MQSQGSGTAIEWSVDSRCDGVSNLVAPDIDVGLCSLPVPLQRPVCEHSDVLPTIALSCREQVHSQTCIKSLAFPEEEMLVL